jgi:hypothetical protein
MDTIIGIYESIVGFFKGIYDFFAAIVKSIIWFVDSIWSILRGIYVAIVWIFAHIEWIILVGVIFTVLYFAKTILDLLKTTLGFFNGAVKLVKKLRPSKKIPPKKTLLKKSPQKIKKTPYLSRRIRAEVSLRPKPCAESSL